MEKDSHKGSEEIPQLARLSKYGRTKLKAADLRSHIITFRMDDDELARLEERFVKSGAATRTEYILAAVLDKTVKSVVYDGNRHQYVVELTNLQKQYRAVGVNYNQAVKALKANFSEKKALTFLHKLEQDTISLVRINREILDLTHKLLPEWSEM